MKIIFLDIDGVINKNGFSYELEKKYIKRLSKIVHRTKAKIVMSSNWRHIYSLYIQGKPLDSKQKKAIEQLLSYFEMYSLSIYDITSTVEYGIDSRPNEIKAYIQQHSITSFVILDDEDIWNWKELQSNLVLTKSKGLSFFHVLKAIRILERG